MLLVVIIYHGVKAVLKEVFKVAVAAIVWRFVTGAHLHGEKRSDAGWWSHGSKGYGRDGHASKWELKPRGHRALWRLACLFAFSGVITGLCVAFSVTVHALEALIVYGLVVLGFIIESKLRLRVHNRHVINPIVKSLAVALRLNQHAVRRMLHLRPEDIKDEGEVGYLELPPELTPGDDQKTTVERIIDTHLPVDIEIDWRMLQAPKLGVIRAGLRPPSTVVWAETVEAMRTAAFGDIVIGKDRYKQVFTANFLQLDDPHWAFCVQSKRGKSNFLGLVSVQVLHQDPQARVCAIDPKRSSLIDFLGSPDYNPEIHNGLKPLIPGVTMANDPTRPEQMMQIVTEVRKLFDARSKEYSLNRGKHFPICLLVIDELNMLRECIKDMWSAYLAENKRRDKEDREDLPGECPIWADIRTLLQAGRFVGIHVIAVAQDFRDDAIGGKGARNYFGLRGLGGYQPNQWDMLVGPGTVRQVAQKGVGRWIFCQGEDQNWVQITRCDPDEAYAWGSYGRELFEDETSVHDPRTTVLSPSLEADATHGHTPTVTAAPPAVRIVVGLREAAKYLGYDKPDSFRRARERWMENNDAEGLPGEFRQGRSPAWAEEALTEWAASLPRRGK